MEVSWQGKTDSIQIIEALSLKEKIDFKTTIVDVRKSEFKSGHIKNSLNIPLDKLNKNINKTSINGEFYIHCAGGYRSMIASSILKRKGIHTMTDVIGGFSAIKSAQIPIEI